MAPKSATETSPGTRPALRADAVRNRERLLAAARQLLAEQGSGFEMTDIASAAGVGVGTLYRHFPDRDALMTDLITEKFAELSATQHRVLEMAELSARGRLDRMIRAACEIQARDRGLHEALNAAAGLHEPVARSTPGLIDGMDRLVREAIADGSVRDDLTWEDLVMCICATGHTIVLEDSLPGSWERLLEIQLAGLDPR